MMIEKFYKMYPEIYISREFNQIETEYFFGKRIENGKETTAVLKEEPNETYFVLKRIYSGGEVYSEIGYIISLYLYIYLSNLDHL